MKNPKLSPIMFVLFSFPILASCSKEASEMASIGESTPRSSMTQDNNPLLSEKSSPISSSPIPTDTSTISKTVLYRTDHGKHTVSATFNLTLKSDGTIENVIATMNRGDHESLEYITRFNNATPSKLNGKKISSITFTSIWGASDTTIAFLQALSSP